MPFQKMLFGSLLMVLSAGALAQTPMLAPSRATPYTPVYSEKIEADNGAVYAVDLKTARHFGNLVQAGVYDLNRQIQIAGPMWFQCEHALVGTDPRSMTYAPPRSVGARLLAIACAEADRREPGVARARAEHEEALKKCIPTNPPARYPCTFK